MELHNSLAIGKIDVIERWERKRRLPAEAAPHRGNGKDGQNRPLYIRGIVGQPLVKLVSLSRYHSHDISQGREKT